MGAIRIEADSSNDMAQVYSWLSRNRGQVVPLDIERSVTLGVPISGARAVIVPAVLENGVGGVLRAISNPAGGPVRLAFDIRAKGGLDQDTVREIGADVLDAVSRQIAGEELIDQVA